MKEWIKIEGAVRMNVDGIPEIEVNNLCDDCGFEINHFMMTDLCWEEVTHPDDKDSLVLCWDCFRMRIDRNIYPSDFMECDANEPFMSWARQFIFRNNYEADIDMAREGQPKSSGPMAPPG